MDQFYISLYQKNQSRQSLITMMRYLYTLQEQNKIQKIDNILHGVNINRMENGIILALLRSTYEIKSKLNHWETFLNKAKPILKDSPEEEQLLTLIKRE